MALNIRNNPYYMGISFLALDRQILINRAEYGNYYLSIGNKKSSFRSFKKIRDPKKSGPTGRDSWVNHYLKSLFSKSMGVSPPPQVDFFVVYDTVLSRKYYIF